MKTTTEKPSEQPAVAGCVHPLVRRLGRFRVSHELVKSHPDGVMKALAECLIVRCEMRYATMTLDYEAISPHFAECPEWCEPPEYEAIMETVNTGTDEEPVWEARLKEFRLANADVMAPGSAVPDSESTNQDGR